MALTIGDNFSYMGAKPLDGRLKYDTVASMKAMADSVLYDGCLAYCVATGKTYQWKSTNDVDATLGKWREFESGTEITVDDEISASSENPVQNKVIKGALDGKADLVSGKVPAAELPSYVDDVIEGYYKEADGKFYEEDTYTTEIVGETGKIYVSLDTNKSYRWTGSTFAEIINSSAANETIDYEDFEELPQSEKDNGTAYFVPDVNVESGIMVFGNRFDKANIYTADERMVGSYLGKPLYQKVVDLGELKTISNSTWTKVGISSSGMETVLRAFGTNNYSGSGTFTLSSELLTCAKDGEIAFLVGRDGEIFECRYIILQYTKLSDGTVSVGTSNDYSTDEQIIGTWIDGKKLYQKTINFGALPNNTSKSVAHGISNFGKLISLHGTLDSGALQSVVPFSYPDGITYNVGAYVTSTELVIKTGTDRTSDTAYVTIQYTKTTD